MIYCIVLLKVRWVHSSATAERYVSNAETFLRLNDIQKALNIWRKMIEEFPADYIGWFGPVKVYFECMYKDEKINMTLGYVIANLQRAVSCNPERREIVSYFKQYLEKIESTKTIITKEVDLFEDINKVKSELPYRNYFGLRVAEHC